MISYNVVMLKNHDSLEKILDNFTSKDKKGSFLIVSDWDEVCKDIIKALQSRSDKTNTESKDVFIVSTWDTPDGTQMIRESLDIKTRITRVPTLITIKDNNVHVHFNNGDIYRELGL